MLLSKISRYRTEIMGVAIVWVVLFHAHNEVPGALFLPVGIVKNSGCGAPWTCSFSFQDSLESRLNMGRFAECGVYVFLALCMAPIVNRLASFCTVPIPAARRNALAGRR
jgi:hypothetical protein